MGELLGCRLAAPHRHQLPWGRPTADTFGMAHHHDGRYEAEARRLLNFTARTATTSGCGDRWACHGSQPVAYVEAACHRSAQGGCR